MWKERDSRIFESKENEAYQVYKLVRIRLIEIIKLCTGGIQDLYPYKECLNEYK